MNIKELVLERYFNYVIRGYDNYKIIRESLEQDKMIYNIIEYCYKHKMVKLLNNNILFHKMDLFRGFGFSN
jgi:hypothetical protein